MDQAPKTRDEIEAADVVFGIKHVVLLTNGFPRVIVSLRPLSLFWEQVA